MLTFGIERWDAWTTGIRDKEDWAAFLAGKKVSETAVEAVEYLHLKPRQRRRLSDISKITLDVAFGAAFDAPLEATMQYQQIPTVFASRRGEVDRMAGLLQDICSGEEASPTAFSLSVHNTTSGLFSIQTGNQAPSTAIAAGHDTVAAAFIEACSQLANGHKRILLVISEDTLPEVYDVFGNTSEQPIAAAFLLNDSRQFVLESSNEISPTHAPVSKQIHQCLRLLLKGQAAVLAGERMPCRILPA